MAHIGDCVPLPDPACTEAAVAASEPFVWRSSGAASSTQRSGLKTCDLCSHRGSKLSSLLEVFLNPSFNNKHVHNCSVHAPALSALPLWHARALFIFLSLALVRRLTDLRAGPWKGPWRFTRLPRAPEPSPRRFPQLVAPSRRHISEPSTSAASFRRLSTRPTSKDKGPGTSTILKVPLGWRAWLRNLKDRENLGCTRRVRS